MRGPLEKRRRAGRKEACESRSDCSLAKSCILKYPLPSSFRQDVRPCICVYLQCETIAWSMGEFTCGPILRHKRKRGIEQKIVRIPSTKKNASVRLPSTHRLLSLVSAEIPCGIEPLRRVPDAFLKGQHIRGMPLQLLSQFGSDRLHAKQATGSVTLVFSGTVDCISFRGDSIALG